MGQVVAEIAARQHGVVTRAQLVDLGWDGSAIRRRVTAGYLHEAHRHVYAVGQPTVSWSGKCMAAVLACGLDAALSHRAAADLHGLRRSAVIEVTIPHHRDPPPAVKAYRSRMADPVDFTEVDGVPVTSVARTLLDLAAVLGERHLSYALDRAERLRLFDLRAIEDVLVRARGRRGVRALRNAIAGWQPADTWSELERLHVELVTAAGLQRPELNVVVQGELRQHVVDALWPDQGLVVQLDGFAYHRTRRDRERDAAADADLELAGYRVLRLTWDDVTVRGARTVRRLRNELTRRSGPAAGA